MATERIRYVNTASTGGDGTTNNTSGVTAAFSTLSASIAYEVSAGTGMPDLVGGDSWLHIYCSGVTADTTGVIVNGFTTDATRYILIEAYTGQEAQMPLNTGRYRLQVASYAIQISDPFVYLRRLQLGAYNHTSASARRCIDYTGLPAGAQYVERCLLYGDFTAGNGQGSSAVSIGDTDPTYYLVNNFIVNLDQATCRGIYHGVNAVCYAYGNTIVNCVTGISSAGTGLHVKNNGYAKGASGTDGFLGTFNADATGNISDIASDDPATTAGPPTFAGVTDFHLVSGDAWIGQGADLRADAAYNVTVDFDGDTRVAVPCVGADEYAASGFPYNAVMSTANMFQNKFTMIPVGE